MSCFHFMYYDVLLTALPVLLLLTDLRHYFQPILVGVLPVPEAERETALIDYFQPRLVTGLVPGAAVRRIYVLNSLTLSLLALLAITEFVFPLLNITISVSAAGLARTTIPMPLKYGTGLTGTPWNLFCLMALWLWCGVLWWRTPKARAEGGDPPAVPLDGSATSLKADAAQLV